MWVSRKVALVLMADGSEMDRRLLYGPSDGDDNLGYEQGQS